MVANDGDQKRIMEKKNALTGIRSDTEMSLLFHVR